MLLADQTRPQRLPSAFGWVIPVLERHGEPVTGSCGSRTVSTNPTESVPASGYKRRLEQSSQSSNYALTLALYLSGI